MAENDASVKRDEWCRWAAQPVTEPVRDNFDRDGCHPSKVTCPRCKAKLTPILLTQHGDWFYPAHRESE